MLMMKKLALALSLTMFSAGICVAQAPAVPDTQYEYALVRMIEVATIMYPSEIVIAYGSGKTEAIELDKFAKGKWAANADKMHLVLSRLMSQGYELVTSNGGNGDAVFTSTYFFRRRKQ